jgi:hypothetical protein
MIPLKNPERQGVEFFRNEINLYIAVICLPRGIDRPSDFMSSLQNNSRQEVLA